MSDFVPAGPASGIPTIPPLRVSALESKPAQTPDWTHFVRPEELGDGLSLNVFDFEPDADYTLSVAGPPTFCIALYLDGRCRLALDNGRTLEVTPGTLILFHAPHESGGRHQILGGSRVLCLDFRFTPELIAALGISPVAPLLRAFTADCSVQDALLLGRPLTSALRGIARDALHCPLQGIARRVFLRAKALEALSHVIAATQPEEPARVSLTRRDRARVEEAARLLAERYSEPWTIASLARTAGINERKLKAGFRLLLGRTVHAYLEETRLDAAAHAILEGLAVTEVALSVGYANPSHFAKLFRRRCGVAPSEWRRLAQSRGAATI
jgi:AraC-like DNA-binding protein